MILRIFLLTFLFVNCADRRSDIAFEAFSDSFMDWYSLKLYSNQEFDMHIPVIDIKGTYMISADTIFLKSAGLVPGAVSNSINRGMMKAVAKDESWIFIIDDAKRQIRSIKSPSGREVWMEIVIDNLVDRGL